MVTMRDIRLACAPPAISYEEGKGHISVNPVYGCRVGCPFCVSLADPWAPAAGAGIRRFLAPVDEILDALHKDAARVRRLRLSLLDFTDPFDPQLSGVLRSLLTGLSQRLPGSVVLLTTRLHPGRSTVRWLTTLRDLDVSVFVSLGDAAGGVRPVTSVRRRLQLLADCADAGLHTATLLRPLVREWTRIDALRDLLEIAARSSHEIVMGGLRTTPDI